MKLAARRPPSSSAGASPRKEKAYGAAPGVLRPVEGGLRPTDDDNELVSAEGGGVEEVRLSQDLTLLDITMLGVGALMGGGVFVLLGLGAEAAGPGLLLAFFLNGLITIPTMMVYAQLGSAFHDAGGGYLWIKEALAQPWGFLGGWMGWFSHAVACAVYALASGFFLAWLLKRAGLVAEAGGGSLLVAGAAVPEGLLIAVSAAVFALGFVLLNYVGVKQSVKAENAINALVLTVVLVFLGFGLWKVGQRPDLVQGNFADFMPKGMGGVFAAMGITFIAFEGYEIISQSSEEVKNPRRNVPRAIFISMLGVWAVILLTTVVTIGLVTAGPSSWEFLGAHGSLAVVEAAPFVFPASWGAYASLVMLASAMLLQLVGLNATIYSSSRVSFAMGRDGNLPRFFRGIHRKYRTPHGSVLASGVIILVMALALPIKSVAVAADVMFLLMFILVNVAYVKLHRTMPAERFGFRAPLFPWLPLAAIVGKALLTGFLLWHEPLGSLAAFAWLGVGLGFYYVYVHPRERALHTEKRGKEVLHEARRGPQKDFRILVPVSNPANVPGLALAAKDLAKGLDAEVIFVYIVRMPEATPLREGARFVDEARPLFHAAERVIGGEVPMHSIVRIGHNVGEAIRSTAEEKGASLLLIGWRGDRSVPEMVLGATLDTLVENPPCDVAVLKLRGTPPPGKILVPTHGGGHAPLSMRLAGAIARARGASVTVYNVVPPEEEDEMMDAARKAKGRALLQQSGAGEARTEIVIEHGSDPVECIVRKGEGYDLLVVGATTEPAWRNYLFGAKPEQITERFQGSVLMVKSHLGKRSETMRRLGRRLKRAWHLLRPA